MPGSGPIVDLEIEETCATVQIQLRVHIDYLWPNVLSSRQWPKLLLPRRAALDNQGADVAGIVVSFLDNISLMHFAPACALFQQAVTTLRPDADWDPVVDNVSVCEVVFGVSPIASTVDHDEDRWNDQFFVRVSSPQDELRYEDGFVRAETVVWWNKATTFCGYFVRMDRRLVVGGQVVSRGTIKHYKLQSRVPFISAVRL